MSKLFIKNATSQSIAFNAKVSPSTNLANHGPAGATVIIDDEITSCLAVNDTIPPVAISDKTAVFDLPDTNRYAVEINGVIIPYSFAAKDLPKCFDGTHESLIRFHGEPRPAISCVNASPTFTAKDSYESNRIDVSVDGGPWTELPYLTKISGSVIPGSPGADITLSLIDETPRKIRLRVARDIGLYVNPNTGIDQINTNTAYTLFNRQGDQIDPFNVANQDHSGYGFDDISTDDDFTVFFTEAEFCLAPRHVISCEGATNSVMIKSSDATGYGSIELNGVIYGETGEEALDYLIHITPELNSEIAIRGELEQTITNINMESPARIRVFPKGSAPWVILPSNTNPTAVQNDDGSISVCLSPQGTVADGSSAWVTNITDVSILTNTTFRCDENAYTTKSTYANEAEFLADVQANFGDEVGFKFSMQDADGIRSFVIANTYYWDVNIIFSMSGENISTGLTALPYVSGPKANPFTYPANDSLEVINNKAQVKIVSRRIPTEIEITNTGTMTGSNSIQYTCRVDDVSIGNNWWEIKSLSFADGTSYNAAMDQIMDYIITKAAGKIILVGPEGGRGHIQKVASGYYVGAGAVDTTGLTAIYLGFVITGNNGDMFSRLFGGSTNTEIQAYGEQVFPAR